MTTPAPTLPVVAADELRELLCAYFFARDELYEVEADPTAPDSRDMRDIHRQAVIDLADELVARFVPDQATRCTLTGECPTDLAYNGPAHPRQGETVSAIQPGAGRITGTVEAVTDRGVLVQWHNTDTLPITYPRSQVVPTALGWHIRRS